MKQLEPIYPELVEKIKAEYQAKIDAASSEAIKPALQTMCREAVAKEIGRQRQEAISRGGELGARIKAENEAMMKELEAESAKIDPGVIEDARKFEEANRITKLPRFCPNCGAPVKGGKFCTECGTKLI